MNNTINVLVEGAGPVQPQHELLQALVSHGEGLAGHDQLAASRLVGVQRDLLHIRFGHLSIWLAGNDLQT